MFAAPERGATKQPTTPGGWRSDHPLLRNPLVLFSAHERGVPASYVPVRTAASNATSFAHSVTRDGIAYLTDGTSASMPLFSSSQTVSDFTVFWRGLVSDFGVTKAIFQAGENFPTAPRNGAFALVQSSTSLRFEAYINGTGTTRDVTVASTDEIKSLCIVRAGTTVRCYLNGVNQGTITVGSTASVTFDRQLLGGHYFSGAYNQPGIHRHVLFGLVDNPWSDAAVADWHTNPWQLFEPEPIEVYWSTASGPTYTLTAAQGSFTLTGQAAGLTASRLLTAAQGSYTLTGQAATLKAARLITAAQGSYTLTGQDATLTYTPAVTYTLTAAQGAFTLTGQAAGLTAARLLTAAQGTYSLTGVAASLSVGSGLLRGRPMRRSRRPIWVIEGSKKKCLRRRCERSGNISPRLQQLPTLFRSSERFGRLWN